MLRRLWLTGYRSYELNIYRDQDPKLAVIKYSLKKRLQAYLEDGLEWLITGAQLGTEQWGINVAAVLKADYPDFKIALMFPFQEFGSKWNEDHQRTLTQIQQQADFVGYVSQQPYQNPSQLKNYQYFMGQHTDGALLLYDPESPGKPQYDYQYLQTQLAPRGYPFDLLDFYDLQDEAEVWSQEQAEKKPNKTADDHD